MAEINICSSSSFTQDMAKEYSLLHAVPWKRQQRETRANFCTPGTPDIPAPKDNLHVWLCHSQRRFLQRISPENMAKHLSFSAPTGASWPVSLCSLPPSVSMASFSHPLLWGENKAGLFHDLTDRLNDYLHHVDEVQKEFLGILLSVSGKFWVPLSNERLKHAGSNAILHTLQITT